MGPVIAIYSCLIVYFLIEKQYDYLFAVLISIPFIILIYFAYKKIRIKNIQIKIEKVKEDIKNSKESTPFININKREKWYILELIPGISRLNAKKIENRIRKRQGFKDFVELANFCNLDIPHYEAVKRIIKF